MTCLSSCLPLLRFSTFTSTLASSSHSFHTPFNMKSFGLLAGIALFATANAYPNILAHLEETSEKRATPTLGGLVPFNAKSQLVNVKGKNAFKAPGPSDQRGPCPGLNALANHNYLPHNGVATIQQFIDSTTKGLDVEVFDKMRAANMTISLWNGCGPRHLLGRLRGGVRWRSHRMVNRRTISSGVVD